MGHPMHIFLPASTDIYLTGGKSHDSETRLARLLIRNLNKGNTFVDVGAHYGYFTLLAAQLVKEQGKVIAYEASPKSFALLQSNTKQLPQIDIRNEAVSSENGQIEFYQFPNLYSEYNSIDAAQFEKEEWFQKAKPEKIVAKAIQLDSVFTTEKIIPKIIKIDVEGAEYQVLKGMETTLANAAPQIVMEYLSASRGNAAHKKAAALLYEHHFQSFSINSEGQLDPCPDIEDFIEASGCESDNIVFMKG